MPIWICADSLKETIDLPEDFLASQPWVIALTLVGDHRIENLTMQRKADRKQSKTLIRGDNEEGEAMDEMEKSDDSLAREYTWREDQVGEDPETIYIRTRRFWKPLCVRITT